ncbi:A-type carbonic anhydrase [Xanthomonas citri pv. citri]|nr:A-type carbonic anhydrase [Xanthomonas citri pv. citri]CEH94509.1 A-type carbonic anhydrase [Xanthomonas citri pv. citri]
MRGEAQRLPGQRFGGCRCTVAVAALAAATAPRNRLSPRCAESHTSLLQSASRNAWRVAFPPWHRPSHPRSAFFLPEFVHARFQVASVTSHQPAVPVHRRRLGRGGHGANRTARKQAGGGARDRAAYRAIDANLGTLLLSYSAVPLVVRNTGHSIQLDLHDGGSMATGGKQYQALQLHFHHPSEHLLNGRRFPMEAHLVHQGPDGTLGVLAIFFETGKANTAFQRVLDAMPKDKDQTRQVANATVSAEAFLPPSNQRSFYRYEGSLTTPPCSETVDWVVLSQPVQVSEAQINAFERVYPFNARPLQPLDRRFLLKSH